MTVSGIYYTDTAKESLKSLFDHLISNNVLPLATISLIDKVLLAFEDRVIPFPLGCPLFHELVELGCNKYRECNTAKGYRIIYSLNNDNKMIIAHVILVRKQDIKSLLFKRIIN